MKSLFHRLTCGHHVSSCLMFFVYRIIKTIVANLTTDVIFDTVTY